MWKGLLQPTMEINLSLRGQIITHTHTPTPPLPLPEGSAGRPEQGSRWVLFAETAADHQSAMPANLQLTLLHPSKLPPAPHPPTDKQPPSIPPPSHSSPVHTLSLSLCPLSIYLYLPHFWCKDPGSTLQWRQIRPSRPCHRKTSHRKVATSSPFQLICRHGKRGEQEGSPCSSITTLSTLSREGGNKIRKILINSCYYFRQYYIMYFQKHWQNHECVLV